MNINLTARDTDGRGRKTSFLTFLTFLEVTYLRIMRILTPFLGAFLKSSLALCSACDFYFRKCPLSDVFAQSLQGPRPLPATFISKQSFFNLHIIRRYLSYRQRRSLNEQ